MTLATRFNKRPYRARSLTLERPILPAKLTPIEEYFLLDDSPAYPMTVLMRLRFAGRLDRTAFEAAVSEVCDRHPLLRARVRVVGESKRWVDCPDWQPSVKWDVDCAAASWPAATFIDIREEPGTRFSVVSRDEYDEVIVQVHHCATDAKGMCRLTEDLLVAYECAVGVLKESPPQQRNIDADRFRRRGMPGLPRWRFTLMIHRWRARWNDCMHIARSRCSQLLPDELRGPVDKPHQPYPAINIIRFDRVQTAKLVDSAKSQKVSVNSVLLRDLFLSIRDWQSKLGVNQQDDTLRICIPVDLRTWRDKELPVANAISLLFMDRAGNQMTSAEELLAGIYEELHGKKRQDLRISFVTMLGVARHLPGGMRRWLDKQRCWSTCIFSSLGILFRDLALPENDDCLVTSGLRLVQWDLIPPMRDNLGLTICPYTYGGRLSIVFNYDPSRMNRNQLSMMLQTYLSRLESSAGLYAGEIASSQSA